MAKKESGESGEELQCLTQNWVCGEKLSLLNREKHRARVGHRISFKHPEEKFLRRRLSTPGEHAMHHQQI